MLTRVDVQSENPFFLNIRDARPTDSIIVEKIEGLNPPDIDLFIGDYARDGGSYGGRRVPPRDVTFTLQYNPNYKNNESVSGLRTMLYKAFLDPYSADDNLKIVLHDDEVPDRYFTGYTSKFEGDLFSDETIAQIVMRCPNPYLLDSAETLTGSNGPSHIFQYHGTAETGFETGITVTSPTNVLNLDLNGKRMTLTYPFVTNDLVSIDTQRGFRRIQVIRGTTTDILYAMTSPPSSWLELHNKDNLIKVYGETASSNVANIIMVRFRAQHWGV